MESLLPLLLLISITSVIGLTLRAKKGVIKKGSRLKISEGEFDGKYGSRLTILQFSTTFCSECRTAKAIVKDVVKDSNDITYVEVDAESNLDLVRRVDIRSTPTTIFLDSKGFEIARAKGAPKRDQLIKAIKAI
jgi:thiol-disulfide isomerase/thioredoxin